MRSGTRQQVKTSSRARRIFQAERTRPSGDSAAFVPFVDFIVSGDGFTTTSFTSNKWMFTDATVFSGSKVSPDDGIWGAGPGEVNGNGDCYGDTASAHNGFYGFGNCNSGDGSSTVYYGPDGAHSCPSLKVWTYA